MKKNPSSRPIWLIGITLLTLTALVATASARPQGDGPPIEARIEKLDLDAETQARVDGILDAAHEQRRSLRRELREARTQLRELVGAGAGAEALYAQAETLGALDLRRHQERIGMLLELREVLSPEQVASLLERDEEGGRRYRRRAAR